MPGFRYQAYSIEGKLHRGVLEADSARQARSTLRDQGLTPYRVEVIAANDAAGGRHFRALSLSSAELTRLTRSLASLVEAGLTVEQAFNALIEQAERERERQVLAALRGEVMAGLGERILEVLVGLELGTRRSRLVVARVLPDSSAERTGLETGDVIAQINGERVSNFEEANRVLARGHTRSSVLLVIQRGAFAYQLPFPLEP